MNFAPVPRRRAFAAWPSGRGARRSEIESVGRRLRRADM